MMGDSAMQTIGGDARPDAEHHDQVVDEAGQGVQETEGGGPEGSGGDRVGEERRQVPRQPGRGGDSGLYPPKNPGRSTRMIGEVAVDLGFADLETVEEAVAAARAQGRPTGLVLVERGILRHDQLARVVAERFGLDFVDLSVYDLDMGAVNLVSVSAAKRYQAVPVGYSEDGAL